MTVKSTHRHHQKSRLLSLFGSTALAGVMLLSPATAQAQSRIVWEGGLDDDFGNGGNWVGGTAPADLSVTAVFDGTGTSDAPRISSETLLAGLEFSADASSYTLSVNQGGLGIYSHIVNASHNMQTIRVNSGSLQMANGASIGRVTIYNSAMIQFDGSSNASAATIINHRDVTLRGTSGHATLSIGSLSGNGGLLLADNAGHNVELGGLGLDDTLTGSIISYDGVGDAAITKVGSGTLTLSGNSNYSGGTRISAGTIRAASDSALGAGLVTLAGGSLALAGTPTIENDVELAATGTIRFEAGATGTLNGAITTNGLALRLNAEGTGTINGDIVGSTSLLDKLGSGTLTVNGVVSGTGAGIAVGSGTLVLNNANTYGGGSGSTGLSNATLVLGHDRALSTSRLSVGGPGAVLSVNKDISLANNVSLFNGAGLTVDTAGHALDMAAVFQIVGTSAHLTKVGAGTLTLTGDNSHFAGNAIVSEGTLAITGKLQSSEGTIDYTGSNPAETPILRVGSDALWTADVIKVGDDGTGSVIIENGGHVVGAVMAVAHNINGVGAVTVSGQDSSWMTDMASIGHYGNATLLVEAGGRFEGEVITIGGDSLATGAATIAGGGSIMQARNSFTIGVYGNGALNLTDGGHVAADGLNINLAAAEDAVGTMNFGAASGEAAATTGTLEAGAIIFGPGTGRIVFNHTGNPDGSDLRFGTFLTGQGTILHENGTTVLTKDNSGFAGTTTVSGGTLVVGNRLGGATTVASGGTLLVGNHGYPGAALTGDVSVNLGGTLGGIGAIGGNVEVSGILSAGNSPGTLTINGNLALTGDATSIFELNTPGVIGGSGATGNDLISVAGDLTLGGALDVRVASAGYYRLFNYDRSLTGTFDSGTLTGTGGFVPVGSSNPDIRYDVPGQVNLAVLGAGQIMQFWDGAGSVANNMVDGGSGTWTGFATNWTDSIGTANGGWQGSVGVFAGAVGGTVLVEGAQSFDTLQFSTNGYELTGGTLAFAPANGSAATIQVDGGVAAAVSSALTDGVSGQRLVKTGAGTLTLTGSNSYTGGTELQAGTLSVSRDANLGIGDLVFGGGALAVTSGFDTSRAVSLEASGRIIVAGGETLELNGEVSGAGDLVKAGDGTLRLSGGNLYGDTIVEAGRLISEGLAVGGGNIANAGVVEIVAATGNDISIGGDITGHGGVDGRMIKRGGGLLSLSGASSLDWDIEQGEILTNAVRFTSDAHIAAGASLHFVEDLVSAPTSYAGTLSGDGELTRNGNSLFTLTGDSSGFAGTTRLMSGTMRVEGALGGSIELGSGASIEGNGALGAVAISGTGELIGRSGDTLSMASLALGSEANVAVLLGTPSGAALFDVGGDLVLDGTLHVMDAGGFAAGVYRLFDYGGELTDNGLEITTRPTGVDADDLHLQTGIFGRVNLISTAGVELRFWDGDNASLHDNDAIDGGAGTWTATGRGWTDMDGMVNGPMKPIPAFAVFQGAAGTVTLDASEGGLAVAGMQFAVDGYTLDGDALDLQGSDGRTVIRVGDSSAASAEMTATIASALTGTGDLVKADRGTLILTGANSYAGNTIVEAGTLTGSVGAIRGNIANAGTLVFDQAADASFAGSIAGLGDVGGEMVKRGAGSLTLTGASTLDWSVEAGELVTATQRFTGDADIAEGAMLRFDQGADGSYAGSLTGTGTLGISGGAQITLSGDSGDFAGEFDVRDGTVVASGTLGGTTRIGDGGFLVGTGTVGTTIVAAGGTIAPGNSIGTLTIDGNLTFAEDSTYLVETDPMTGASDRIAVTGQALLEGGAVVHVGLDADYRHSTSYTILTAEQGVEGRFADATSDFAFLDAVLGYADDAVTLTLARNDIDFSAIGSTRNQRATAGAVETLGFGAPVFEAVVMLGADDARGAFDQLSGEIHATLPAIHVENSRFIRAAALDRMRLQGASVDADRGTSWWMQGIGNWGRMASDGNAHRVKHSAQGVLMGVDAIAAERVQLGVFGGWQTADANIRRLGSEADIDSYHLGLYAGADSGALSLRTGFAFSWHDAKVTRQVGFSGFSDSLRSDRRASTAQGFAEIGYRLAMGETAIEPFANIAHVAVDSEAARERGGTAALSATHRSMAVTFTTLGARIAQSFTLAGVAADLTTSAGWRHAFGDRTPEATLAFAGADRFTIAGTPVARDALAADIGLGLTLSARARLDIAYTGDVASSAHNHSGKATLSIGF